MRSRSCGGNLIRELMAKSTSRKTRANRSPAARRARAPRKAAAPAKPARKVAAKAPAKGKWVYRFGNGRAEGRADMRDLLGGKGAGLAEMANLGLPVPPGFTLSAKLCITYLEAGTFPAALRAEVDRHLKQLEKVTGKGFGDARNPLLVSVRSGAAVSMPGMMETILNLGLNDQTVEGLIAGSNNPRFAYDSYRRFVQMYGDVVFDLGKEPFEDVLTKAKARRKVERDIDLPAEDLQART